MNNSYKSVLNRSTDTYVAASESVKASGKSPKNKLAMKVASASLALGASIAMLSSGHAVAEESVSANEHLATKPDEITRPDLILDKLASTQTEDSAPAATGTGTGAKLLGSSMLGSQLLGATPTGASVLYDDSTNKSITFAGTAGTKLSNVAAGVLSATSTDAVNGSQLYPISQTVQSIGIGAQSVGSSGSSSGLSMNAAATAVGGNSIVFGGGALASSMDSTVIGAGAYGTVQSTALGNAANAGATAATSVGYGSSWGTAGNYSSALGWMAIAKADYSSALGATSTASASRSVALGYGSVANVANTVSVGTTSATRKIVNVTVGDISLATSTDAVNGSQLYATNQIVAANTTAIATNASNITANTMAIATNTSDIATNSTATATNTSNIAANASDVSTLNTQIADAVKYDGAAHDTVTLDGTAGTKITNVAAGDISSADSTDAVNGAQLYATNQSVAANTTAIATNTSDIATNATAIATNTSDIATNATAITANTSNIAQNTSDISSINTRVGTLNTQIADAVKYDGAAHDTVTLDGTAGTKITNVAAGDLSSATSTDAINGAQLYATNQNVAENTAAIATNGSDIAANTTAIATNASDIAQNASNIATNTSNISTLNTQIANAVKYDDIEHGSMTLDGSAGTVIKNVAAGQMTADSTEAVNGSQLFAVKQSVSDQGAILADSVRYDSSSHDKITLGASGTRVALTNVKAGDVSATSLDAVNGSQLYALTQDVTQNTTDIAGLTASMNDLSGGTTGLVSQDATTLALSVGANTGGGAISFAGLDGPRVLTGVANGAVSRTSTEAVNGSQLFRTSTSTAAALGGGAGVDAGGGVTAPSYAVGGKRVSDVGSAVSNLDDRVTQNSADIASVKGGLADVSKTVANAVAYDSVDHNNLTLGGTDASTAVRMTNLAAGDLSSTSTDAVNGGQLGETNARVSATESAIAHFEALGVSGSKGTGEGSATIGSNADASGKGSTAAGANSVASGEGSTATGAYATASGNAATAAGTHSTASGEMSAAIGGNAAASGTNAVAIGGNSLASGSASVAFGGNSNATADNSVALGANSVADDANTVSVGSAGNERRVTNVAPGVNGTDATNVNQLSALRNDVNSSMTQLRRSALGGVAAAMAMPNLMPSSPGKTVVGAGVANYKGYNAIAAGATYRSENNRWLMNGAVSVTQNGDSGVRAQAGYEF